MYGIELLCTILYSGDYRRFKAHPTGHPAILVALAAAFDPGALEYDNRSLRLDAKPHVTMQQLTFVEYKVPTQLCPMRTPLVMGAHH